MDYASNWSDRLKLLMRQRGVAMFQSSNTCPNLEYIYNVFFEANNNSKKSTGTRNNSSTERCF